MSKTKLRYPHSPHTRLQNVGWHSLYVLVVLSAKTYTCSISEVVNTLPFHGRGAGSIPASSTIAYRGMGERFNPEHLKCSELVRVPCVRITLPLLKYIVSRYALMLFIHQRRGLGGQNASDSTQFIPPVNSIWQV